MKTTGYIFHVFPLGAKDYRTFLSCKGLPNDSDLQVAGGVPCLRRTLTTVAPPDISLTKSSLSKPAPPVVSPEMRCPSTPRRHRLTRLLPTGKCMDIFFSTVYFLVSSSRDTFVKQSRWFRGSYRRITRRYGRALVPKPAISLKKSWGGYPVECLGRGCSC